MDYEITRKTDGADAYYTVRWSPLTKAEKYHINASVPAMGGLAEMYWRDDHGRFHLYLLARSHFGGLRSTLRAAVDPDVERDPARLAVLLAHEDAIWYRYAIHDMAADIQDVFYFFMTTYRPHAEPPAHSGRFDNIFVKELDADRIVTA